MKIGDELYVERCCVCKGNHTKKLDYDENGFFVTCEGERIGVLPEPIEFQPVYHITEQQMGLLLQEAEKIIDHTTGKSDWRSKSIEESASAIDQLLCDASMFFDAVTIPACVEQPTPTSCYRACVASVLGLDVNEIPVCCDGDTWDWDAFESWLRALGLQAVEMTFVNGGTLYPVQAPVPCILTGPSPRDPKTTQHAVVASFVGTGGFELLHDPYPGEPAWIVGEPTHVTFFQPLDLAGYVEQRTKQISSIRTTQK